MILHLLTDEKFTDYTIKQFSGSEMCSEFVLIPSNGLMNLVALTDRCTIVRQNSPEFDALLSRLDQYTCIILHGLMWVSWQQQILDNVPDNVKVAWVFWGGEIYSRQVEYYKFLAPITKAICLFRRMVKGNKKATSDDIAYRYFQKIDYCLTDEREEFEYASRFAQKQYEYQWYNYYSLEETIGTLLSERCAGNNIMIGNSANAKNNHFDILWKMHCNRKKLNEANRKLVVPLSYGDVWVRERVKRFGKRLFGDRMQALDTFISRDEYNALMLSCSTMILGYMQPAGQGNIITGLWLGMRVYLSEKSMTYQYFKRIGCVVYSMESDLKKYGYAPMEEKDVEKNRAVLKQWYSKESMHKQNLEIVKALS